MCVHVRLSLSSALCFLGCHSPQFPHTRREASDSRMLATLAPSSLAAACVDRERQKLACTNKPCVQSYARCLCCMRDLRVVTVKAVRHKDSVYPQEIQRIIRDAQQFAVK